MSQHFFELIRRSQTAEIAAAVEAHPPVVRSRDAQGISALMLSIYTGQPIIRDFLLARLTDLDIFEAAAVGDCKRLEELVCGDAMLVYETSADGWAPLHLAAAFAPVDAVVCLLEHGAHVHQVSRNPLRNQALHACVALSADPAKVEALIDAGADVNATEAGGYTPLLQAAAGGKRELVQLLLNRGARRDALCHQGKSALDYARERGHGAVVQILT